MTEMNDPLNELASSYFNIKYIFPYQRLVISNILKAAEVTGFYDSESDNEDSSPHQIVLLPTGAGKSLCFMLPAILLQGITIIVFPLLSLMSDQQRRTKEANIESLVLRGGQDSNERSRIFANCRSGTIKMLLTNPETVLNKSVLSELKKLKIIHLVIDETHIVSEWGETFRPVYKELGNLIKELNIPIVTAFTATASPLILSKIKKILFPQIQPNIIYGNPDRANISYSVIKTISPSKTLIDQVSASSKPLIVFSSSRTGTELSARMLRRVLHSDKIYFYHAGLNKDEKDKIEKWFFDSDDGVLVATCAYGLGVDKSDIRTVIHIDLPATVEAYLQESGRGGRDRDPAKAILIYSEKEIDKMKKMTNTLSKKRFTSMIDYAEDEKHCRREKLLSMLGSQPEICSGCDICNNSVFMNHQEKEIFSLLFKNKRRFTKKEAVSFFKGYKSREVKDLQLHRLKGFAMLYDWETDQINETLNNLIDSRKIIIANSGFWKGRLTSHLFRK